jgi:hypothetical protein
MDLARGTVRVRQAYTEVKGQGMVLGRPKSRAGLRTVSLPSAILGEVEEHMRKYIGPGRDALFFIGPKGAAIRRGDFNPLVDWRQAVTRSVRKSCTPMTSGTRATPLRRRRRTAPRTSCHGWGTTRQHQRRDHLPARHRPGRQGNRGRSGRTPAGGPTEHKGER